MAGSARILLLLILASWLATNAIRSLYRDKYWSTRFAAVFQSLAAILLAMFLRRGSNTNNSSNDVVNALLALLILTLFMAGIAMVVEKTPKDAVAEGNKKWFGVAYITFSGILGLYFAYDNFMGGGGRNYY